MNRKLAVRTTADLVRFAAAHGIAVAPRADVRPGVRTSAIDVRRDGMAYAAPRSRRSFSTSETSSSATMC
jgi:hypothetical protein